MSEENKEKEIDLLELISVVWKERKSIIKWGVIGGVIGIVIAFSLPKEYTSLAKVAPEEKQQMSSSMGMLASMMGARASNDFSAVNSMLYQDIIKSSPFVLEFADMQVSIEGDKQDEMITMSMHEYLLKNQKSPWWSHVLGSPFALLGWIMGGEEIPFAESEGAKQGFVSKFNKSVMVEQDEDTRVFTLQSTFQDPVIAKMVLDTMLVKLQDYMNEYHTAKTKETIATNSVMLEDAQARYYKADEEYAEAVDKNRNLVSQAASVKLDRLSNEKTLAFSIYQQIALQLESDKLKLQDQKQIATIIEPTSTPTVPSAPRKFLLIVAFGFLAGFVIVAKIVFKFIK